MNVEDGAAATALTQEVEAEVAACERPCARDDWWPDVRSDSVIATRSAHVCALIRSLQY